MSVRFRSITNSLIVGVSCSSSRVLNSFKIKYLRRKISNLSYVMASSAKTTASTASHGEKKNRLQHEKSPYLLQHQSNPVDWYPWSSEAFEIARSTNKPIFLSVGYSTCHWCHVMERESFENHSIAQLMNEKFINIKVDREERPDIDKIYMTFVQAISGSGGWPMSVWMTPELKPIYGGTYYPPDNRYYGRPGFRSLLETISEQWVDDENKCQQSAEKILDVLKRSASFPIATDVATDDIATSRCIQQLQRSFEPSFGGFSDHPKFPQPVNLLFLMDWILKNDNDPSKFSIIKMVETTLKEMAKGGIHDHIGQGFARYSTDKKWHVPHFEKMLYDQAQLTASYINAYLLTGDELYANVARDILTYVDRDLGHPLGGFFSAEDADSSPTFESKEKKEGAFYVWKDVEIDEILGDKNVSNGKASFADVVKARFGIKTKGNVDPHNDPHDELKEQNVLFQAKTPAELAKTIGIPEEEVLDVLEEARVVLFNYRNTNRPRPGLDTKVVTSWNGLMISGFAKAGMGLKNQAYIDRAVKAMTFLENHVIKSEMGFDLLRSCYRGAEEDSVVNLQTPIFGCVDDFANLVCASLDLYEATFNPKYLKLALKLQHKQDELFWDEEFGGYFTSRAGDPAVIVRMKDDDDGAEPSSNSTSVLNLLRLNSLTSNNLYGTKCEKLLKQFSDRLSKVPITLPVMTAALSTYKAGSTLVLITGKNIQAQMKSQDFKPSLYPVGSMILGIDSEMSEDERKLLNELCPRAKDFKVEGNDIKIVKLKK